MTNMYVLSLYVVNDLWVKSCACRVYLYDRDSKLLKRTVLNKKQPSETKVKYPQFRAYRNMEL